MSKDKIVCAKRGHEALYPSADDFYYDWNDTDDSQKRGMRTFRSSTHIEAMQETRDKVQELYPGWDIIESSHPRRVPVNKDWDFTPKTINKHDIPDCDVIIAPRKRNYAGHRNYQHWQGVVSSLVSKGISVGAVGTKDLSSDVDGLVVRSWDYEGSLDADIQMIQSAKLTLALDSGIAHLAVLCGAPLKIIYDEPGTLPGPKRIKWMMDIHKGYAKEHMQPIIHGWNDSEKVVSETIEFLEEI